MHARHAEASRVKTAHVMRSPPIGVAKLSGVFINVFFCTSGIDENYVKIVLNKKSTLQMCITNP